jgi:hypothetical protein
MCKISPSRLLHAIFFVAMADPGTNGISKEEIPMQSVKQEHLSPSDFLEISESEPELIKSSRFVAPRLGEDHFGYFEVQYKQPVYRPSSSL